jgi:thiosulfate/3-mercaptopyruvate sulfurtransferase
VKFANPQLLIEPPELAKELAQELAREAGASGRSALRVFDATVHLVPAATGYRAESGIENYRAAHIPGAAFMDLIRAFSDTSTGLGFSLPAAADLARTIGAAGIGPEHRVVVYSSGHMMWATRAFWLLRYAGHEHVRVLNGGFAAWQTEGLPVQAGDEYYPPTRFEARTRPGMFTDLGGMQQAMNDPAICTVNALSPEVYAGTGEMHYGRRGHIPGSRNLHYDRLMNGPRFADPDSVHRALTDAGLLAAPRVVAYCGGGISATIDAFACLLMGHPDVAVYDGSMSEWVRNPDLPLRTGVEP